MSKDTENRDMSSGVFSNNGKIAIALALITSITSLGTTLISSKGSIENRNYEELKSLMEKREIEYQKFRGTLDLMLINLKNRSIRESIRETKIIIRDLEDKFDDTIEVVGEEITKNTNRSIMCYASLTEDDIKKGQKIIGFVNGDVYNKNNIEVFPAYLDKNLLINKLRSKDDWKEGIIG